MAKKRKLLSKIKRNKRALVKARLEKNKINEELKNIRARFSSMTPDEARAHVAAELNAISTDDIFPKRMERDFDRLDKRSNRQDDRHVVDLTGQDTSVGVSAGVRTSTEADGDVVVMAEATDDAEEIADVDISEEESESEEEIIDLSNE